MSLTLSPEEGFGPGDNLSRRNPELLEEDRGRSARPEAVQADHGPGSMLDWEKPEMSNLKERLGILEVVNSRSLPHYYQPVRTNSKSLEIPEVIVPHLLVVASIELQEQA